MKNENKHPLEAKQFTFDQKDTVMGWAREKGRPFLQSMHAKFGPKNEPVLAIRYETDAPIEVHINDWIVLTENGLITCTTSNYELNYKAVIINQTPKVNVLPESKEVESVELADDAYSTDIFGTLRPSVKATFKAGVNWRADQQTSTLYTRVQMIEFGEKVREECARRAILSVKDELAEDMVNWVNKDGKIISVYKQSILSINIENLLNK